MTLPESEKDEIEGSSSKASTSGNTSINDCLKRIRELEEEKKNEQKELKELKSKVDELMKKPNETGIKSRLGPRAFGLEMQKYLTGDLKQAAVYLGEFVLPKIRKTVEENRSKFAVIFLLGEKFEHTPMKTCTLFNQGRDCYDGPSHRDHGTNQITRSHFCTICWESLWIMAPHRVVTCPLTTTIFWDKIDIKID
jgi:hypothetical protein